MSMVSALMACIENSAERHGGWVPFDVLEDLEDYPDFATARAFLLYKKLAKKIEVMA